MACRLLNIQHYWTIAIILAICDTFTRGSFSGLAIEVLTPMCACMPVCFQRNLVTFAKARPAQIIFITTSCMIYTCRLAGKTVNKPMNFLAG